MLVKEALKKALSIRQPWLDKILSGERDIEVRSWATPHRGWLVLHASRQTEDPEYLGVLRYRTGVILGVVRLTDVHPFRKSDARRVEDEWEPGCWAWELEDLTELPRPIPYRGRPGLFELSNDLIQEIKRLLA